MLHNAPKFDLTDAAAALGLKYVPPVNVTRLEEGAAADHRRRVIDFDPVTIWQRRTEMVEAAADWTPDQIFRFTLGHELTHLAQSQEMGVGWHAFMAAYNTERLRAIDQAHAVADTIHLSPEVVYRMNEYELDADFRGAQVAPLIHITNLKDS